MKPSNFSPVYCALYPQLAEITREHGYALAIHGSMSRDFDLVCIPWIDAPSTPQEVVDAITGKFAIRQIGKPETKKHDRLVYTISVGFGECSLDLSFMPSANPLAADEHIVDTDIMVDHAKDTQEGVDVPNSGRD